MLVGMTHGLLCLVLLAAAQDPRVDPPGASLRVASYNVRYDTPADGANAWPLRKGRVASLLRFHGPELIGLQEVLHGQLVDLQALLPTHAWIGVGRDDGERAGEYAPILYRVDRLELVEQGTFWLSPTPTVAGSVGWDAALPRIVTWGRFRDRRTGRECVLANAHFDHRGERARVESARLLRDRVRALARGAPTLVTGDLNFTPESDGYRALLEGGVLVDAIDTSETPHHGPRATWSTFEVGAELSRRIDYVLTTPGVRVLRHGVLTEQHDGRYPSDHLPVLVEVEP